MIRSMLHEDLPLRPNARILWEIREKAQQPPVEVKTNLYTHALGKAREALAGIAAEREKVNSREALKRYQTRVRKTFSDCIGGLPEVPGPVEARLTGTYGKKHFVIEKRVLRSPGGAAVTANIYVPLNAPRPMPAVLLMVGHTDAGKADPEYQSLAQSLALHGMLVLVPDPLGEGERFEHYESSLDLQPIQGCSGEHDLMDWKCKLLGQSLARYFIEDGLTALRYLYEREDVDETRIGLTGHSGGGTQVCLMLMAAGERFACAAPCAYMTDTRAMLECGVDPDNEMLWPGSLSGGIDYPEMAVCLAPRPLLILANEHDFFPIEGAHRTLNALEALWRAGGCETPPEMVTAVSGHAYGPTLAQAAVRFFSKHLHAHAKTKGVSHLLPPEALVSLPPNSDPGSLDGFIPLQKRLEARLRSLEAARSPALPASERLERFVGARDVCPSAPRVYDEGICGHYVWRSLIFRPEEGRWLNGVLLSDMRFEDKDMPVSVLLWPGGTAELPDHANLIFRLTAEGRRVFVMDVTAEGALLPAKLAGTHMTISWSTLYKLNAYLIQLGDSLCAMRVRDTAAACRMLAGNSALHCGEVTVYGLGEMGRYALMAGLICGCGIRDAGEYQRFEDIVSQKYQDQTNTHAWILPGFLREFSTAALLREAEEKELFKAGRG